MHALLATNLAAKSCWSLMLAAKICCLSCLIPPDFLFVLAQSPICRETGSVSHETGWASTFQLLAAARVAVICPLRRFAFQQRPISERTTIFPLSCARPAESLPNAAPSLRSFRRQALQILLNGRARLLTLFQQAMARPFPCGIGHWRACFPRTFSRSGRKLRCPAASDPSPLRPNRCFEQIVHAPQAPGQRTVISLYPPAATGATPSAC